MDNKNKDLHTSLLNKVLKTTEETQKCVNSLDKKVDLHIQETKFELKAISETNERQNKGLDEHQQRSTEIKRDNELREAKLRHEIFGATGLEPRVSKLEEPKKVRNLLAKWAVLGAKVVGGVLAMFKIIDLIIKYLL